MADDPRIEELARAGRRRTALSYAVLGVLALIAGAIVIAVVLVERPADGVKSGGQYQLLVIGAGVVAAGVFGLVAAVKATRG